MAHPSNQTAMTMDIETTNTLPSRLSSTVAERFYLNEDYADFYFLFKINKGEYERVPAHKMVLALSDVFRAMFNGDWKEKTEVEITDSSVVVFKEFLQFFYLGKVILTMENVGFVMNLGKMYDVPECLAVCSKFLMNSITNDNVCTAYGLATFFDQENLRKYCELIIANNTKAVLSSNGFLECDRKVLKTILESDYFSCSEVDVFEACMNWVKSKSGQDDLTREILQKQLGELFYQFRFKSMSSLEFARLLPTYGKLFSVDEYVDINQLFALEEFQPTLFSIKQRNSIDSFVYDGMTVGCHRSISPFQSSMPYLIKEVEVTTFSVSEPVLLEGITCHIYNYVNNVYSILEANLATEMEIAQVSEQSDEQILCNQGAVFTIFSSFITLTKPILIRPHYMYEIRFKQSPSANCATGTLLKSEVQIDSDFTVKFYNDTTVGLCNLARGLVSNLTFKKI